MDENITTTKQSIRTEVWEFLEKNNLVNFPRPVFGRIPNFKGCQLAAAKLPQLETFKNAQNIKINPDKPQEHARFLVLEAGKNLFVPVPRLSSGLLKHLENPGNATKEDLRRIVSRKGIDQNGKEVQKVRKIDLVILGSVAVSKQGYRIGKGKGYADLEYAILTELGSVTPETVIITTVHDCQVFEELPAVMFGPHDVPVDVIVTPTQIFKVEHSLPRPTGIIWELLTPRRIKLMPVLKSLKETIEISGREVQLKEIDSDVEISSFKARKSRFRKSKGPNSDTVNIDFSPKNRPKRKNRPSINFSLRVKNIEKNVRVRDLKAALAERGIKPNIITWRGMKGYCCLHFSNTNPNTISNAKENLHGVDNVLGMLQNLSLNTEQQLEIEIMKPISRIETTDITSV